MLSCRGEAVVFSFCGRDDGTGLDCWQERFLLTDGKWGGYLPLMFDGQLNFINLFPAMGQNCGQTFLSLTEKSVGLLFCRDSSFDPSGNIPR